jgi:hypothetical protein
MAKKNTASKAIPVIRIANPWMVGKNVNRVVPLYALHNFACADFVRFKGEQAIKHLVVDAKHGTADKHLAGRFAVLPDELTDLERSAAGLLSPDRRVFRDNKNGSGAGKQGALFPAVGGLLAPTGSDDGLGKRFRDLMDSHDTNWRTRLVTLFGPSDAADPITGFAFRLLGNTPGDVAESTEPRRRKLKGLDLACARFVDNIIDSAVDARRVPAIRRLAVAVYFAALIRLVAGPVEADKRSLPLVWAFGGLPPGLPGDPLIRATSKSFTHWIGQSWDSHAHQLYERLKAIPLPQRTPKTDRLRRRVHAAISEQLSGQHKKLTAAAELMDALVQGQELSKDWCRDALQSDAIGFTKTELARRVRSLGVNVGFAAPNRGLLPRVVLDTPLLDVLVKGIAGRSPMPYATFVTRLREHFGIVVGIGNDYSVIDHMQHFGSEGADAYELLTRNQELLRERLLRAGLARTYSDAHTEVFSHG